jgi:hypothetical protein
MTRSLLRHPPFAFLLSSRVLASMGFQMALFPELRRLRTFEE